MSSKNLLIYKKPQSFRTNWKVLALLDFYISLSNCILVISTFSLRMYNFEEVITGYRVIRSHAYS